MERRGIIYAAINNINGKRYIGKTVKTLFKRKQEHIKNKSTKGFHGALKKYGIDNFSWEILLEVEESQLNVCEKHYIEQYRTFVGFDDCKGYNFTLGGDGAAYGKLNIFSNPTLIKRLSEQRKGKSLTLEHRENVRKGMMGNMRSRTAIDKGMDTIKRNRIAGLHKDKTGKNCPLSKAWIVIFPTGEHVKILGLRAFCREYNLEAKLLRKVANGKSENHKGFKLLYVN